MKLRHIDQETPAGTHVIVLNPLRAGSPSHDVTTSAPFPWAPGGRHLAVRVARYGEVPISNVFYVPSRGGLDVEQTEPLHVRGSAHASQATACPLSDVLAAPQQRR